MENTPEAPAEAPKAPESEAPQTTNEPAQVPDMHGFTSEQLAEMRKFYDANGGFEKVKSKISNPEKPAEAPQPTSEQKEEPTSHTQQPTEAPKTPQGAITASEFLAEQYFKSLAGEEKYKTISDGIRNGDYLKEMAAFGIQALNQDGSINDQKVRMYLDLKAQTVPAKPTETEPNASNAPTVTYTEVGENITSIDQAYKVLMEPGNPGMAKAEEFIKNFYNPNSEKKK
jgi:hypothetical protein